MGVHSNPVSALWVVPRSAMLLRHLNSIVAQFLDTCTKNVKLRAILTGQVGVYHQPPTRATMIGHAAVTNHFLQGSYYPSGGGQIFSDKLGAVVERNGGKILLRSNVERIEIKNGKVTGVVFSSKRLGKRTVSAPAVIVNADIKESLLWLVGEEHLKRSTVAKTRKYEMSPAMGIVYLGVAMDLRAQGYKTPTTGSIQVSTTNRRTGKLLRHIFPRIHMCSSVMPR